MIRLDELGYQRGDYFVPPLVGRVQLRLSTASGDDTTDAIVGHVTALAYLRIDNTSPCPDCPPPLNSPCGLPVDYFYGVDYAEIENNTDLWANANAALTAFNGNIDADQRFQGNASLRYSLGFYQTFIDGTFIADLANATTWPGAPFEDFTLLLRYELEAGINVVSDPWFAGTDGFIFCSFETDDLADAGDYGANWKYHVIYLRDGKVELMWDFYGAQTLYEIGSAASWIGAPKEVRFRFLRASSSSFKLEVTLSDPCETAPLLNSIEITDAGTDPVISYLYGASYIGYGIASPNLFWQYQYAFDGA